MIDIQNQKFMCIRCEHERGQKRYIMDPDNYYCLRCYSEKYPDAEDAHRFRTKQNRITDEIKKKYPHLDITYDKQLPNVEFVYFPDVLIRFPDRNIIVEIDENQHRNSKYDCFCEFKRVFDIHTVLNYDKYLIVIRFNTDNYKDKDGNTIKSIFSKHLENIKCRFEERINTLFETIDNYINDISDIKNPLLPKVIHLFYDADKSFDVEEYYHYLTDYKLLNE